MEIRRSTDVCVRVCAVYLLPSAQLQPYIHIHNFQQMRSVHADVKVNNLE